MLGFRQVGYEEEWVVDAPDGRVLRLRSGTETPGETPPGLPGGDAEGWRTAAVSRRWRFEFRGAAGAVLYRGRVEDLQVTNTSTGDRFASCSWELDWCGSGRTAATFRASGTEAGREATLRALRDTAERHHARATTTPFD